MTYGSQTIQQQGRLIEVRPQEGSVTGEHGKGEGWKVGKNQVKHPGEFKPRSQTCTLAISKNRRVMSKRWKKYSGELIQEIRHYRNKLAIYQDSITSCIHCKADFQKRHGGANKYCSPECHDEFRVMKWLPCSECMAKAGIGTYMAAKLLGIIDASKIRMHWKRRGIKRVETAGIKSGWLRAIKESSLHEDERKMREAAKAYETACMDDIRSHRSHHDWSYIWYKVVAKRKAMDKYHSMSDVEKKRFNKKCQQNRAKKYNSDPEFRRKCREKIKAWSKRNPDKVRGYVNSSNKKRKIVDPGFRVQLNMRKRLKEFIGSAKKGGTQSIRSLIGCSTIQLAKHLESGFTKKMTWSNYGTYWHVDHILPCSSFDHTDPRQVAQCWHWTNLRALEAQKNLDKSDSITEPQMQLLLCATH